MSEEESDFSESMVLSRHKKYPDDEAFFNLNEGDNFSDQDSSESEYDDSSDSEDGEQSDLIE